MGSFNESAGTIEYKSSLELKFFRYCDYNKHIKRFSIEPLYIPYFKTITQKIHKYYIDAYVEFNNGKKFLVEIKSKSETLPPKKPKTKTAKSEQNYRRALQTYTTNMDKWKAARKYCEMNNLEFIILTEEQLK